MRQSFLIALLSVFAFDLTAASAAPAANPCPELNGSFFRQDGEGLEVKTISAGSRRIYSLGNITVVADGKERKIKADGGDASIVASCAEGSVLIAQRLKPAIIEIPAEGEEEPALSPEAATWLKLTPLDKNVLEVESSRISLNGIYLRGKKPKPTPMN